MSPTEILNHIRNKNFLVAEKAIIEFIVYNTKETNALILEKPICNNVLQYVGARKSDESETIEKLCEEYVSCISELFCHANYRPSTQVIDTFLTYKFVIDWLFSVSLWKTTDAIIEHLGLIHIDNSGLASVNTKPENLALLLALISLGSKFKLPWGQFFKAVPAKALSAYIGLVTQPIPALSSETNKGFNHLLESAKDIPIFEILTVADLGKLNFCYFNCSYATSPDKYEFKKWLTTLIRYNTQQWLDEEVKGFIASLPFKQFKKISKPRIGVMLELYSVNHAMYRCYNQFFKSLSKHYNLIAFIDDKDVSEADLSVFEQVITFKNVLDINDNAKLVLHEQLDIVFYPSIGMKFWGIYLSQLRFAPIQAMMGGHPSGSFSPEIDYFLMIGNSHTAHDVQPYYNEKVICLPEGSTDLSTHTKDQALTDDFILSHNGFLESNDNIIIGINGVLIKVTTSIIEVCKRLQQQTSKKLIFVFFSGGRSNQLVYLAAKKQLSRELASFELSSYTDYISYMATISRCHFLLPTLPFGGTNSNVDAMVLNKPKLFIKGSSYLYTRTDYEEWERIGLAEELGCSSTEELIEKALRLIEDNTYRKTLHDTIKTKCSLDRVFTPTQEQNNALTQLFECMLIEHKTAAKLKQET